MRGRGNGFQTHYDYMQGRVDLSEDSDVATLARRVKIEVKPELDAAYPGKWIADITVTYRDGTSESLFIDNPLGAAENPMSQTAWTPSSAT
jgi:2-methylcitrate dehydratase PrpD